VPLHFQCTRRRNEDPFAQRHCIYDALRIRKGCNGKKYKISFLLELIPLAKEEGSRRAFSNSFILEKKCPCDGIGRHASFRNSCLVCVGSSPTGGSYTGVFLFSNLVQNLNPCSLASKNIFLIKFYASRA
jgi:hypothetical protein